MFKYIVHSCHDYFRSHFTNRFNSAEEVDTGTELEVLLPLHRRAGHAQLPQLHLGAIHHGEVGRPCNGRPIDWLHLGQCVLLDPCILGL
jgi:hypothetical protein